MIVISSVLNKSQTADWVHTAAGGDIDESCIEIREIKQKLILSGHDKQQ